MPCEYLLYARRGQSWLVQKKKQKPFYVFATYPYKHLPHRRFRNIFPMHISFIDWYHLYGCGIASHVSYRTHPHDPCMNLLHFICLEIGITGISALPVPVFICTDIFITQKLVHPYNNEEFPYCARARHAVRHHIRYTTQSIF